jgi:C1A family cysteine protease
MGNHAMLIVGYNPQSKEFIVKNSWGTSFGDQGYWYMHENILDQQNAGDVWVLYESVQLLKKS